jgi:glutamate-1-semialdehyde 2,1-aminomutase
VANHTLEGDSVPAVADDDPAAPAKPCPRCRRGQKRFWYLGGLYLYDVDRARQVVADGREPVEVEDESTRESVDGSELDEVHVDHVDPSIPGIIAHVEHRKEDGAVVRGHVLIDGHHRAARCLRDGLVFRASLLSEEESVAVLSRGPDGRPPGAAAKDVDLPEDRRAYQVKFAASEPLFRRAQRVIGGAATHDRRCFGPFPVYVERAEGPYKWDVAGQRLIDYWMGHGSLLLGHSFGPVAEAVARQAARGTHFGAGHELEVRWAELVCRLIPSAERVRFTASGTEATQLALRIARAWTGRSRVVKFARHFHGWHDEAMGHFYPTDDSGFNPATLGEVVVAPTDSPDAAVALVKRGDVAAVILEPGGGSSGSLPWSREFLQALREVTREHGTLLIFDEVISGFRHSPGGVQGLCGVLPDLTTLAKILCGGLPGGAVAGRARYLGVFGSGAPRHERWARVPHTGTFNGNPLSAAAGIAMLEHVADGKPQAAAKAAAERLARRVTEAADAAGVDVRMHTDGASVYHVVIGGRAAGIPHGPSAAAVDLYTAHQDRYGVLRRALLLEGVDCPPVHGWVSAVHTPEVIEETAVAFARAFRRLRGVPGFGPGGRDAGAAGKRVRPVALSGGNVPAPRAPARPDPPHADR